MHQRRTPEYSSVDGTEVVAPGHAAINVDLNTEDDIIICFRQYFLVVMVLDASRYIVSSGSLMVDRNWSTNNNDR